MHTRAISLVAFCSIAAAAVLGVSTDARGKGQVALSGKVCMPAETAARFVAYDAFPVWWDQAEQEEADDGHVPHALIDECMENGLMVFKGDEATWVENPTYEDCLAAMQDWWDDGAISASCRDMGHEKYWSCMEAMETADPEGLWMEHENLCDRAGEACAFACEAGQPQIAC